MSILCAKWVDCFIEYVFFVYDDMHAMEKKIVREYEQYAKQFMQFFAAALIRIWVGAKWVNHESSMSWHIKRKKWDNSKVWCRATSNFCSSWGAFAKWFAKMWVNTTLVIIILQQNIIFCSFWLVHDIYVVIILRREK